MRVSSFVKSVAGHFVIAISSVSLVIAPFGCQTICMFTDCGDGTLGWFINNDRTSDLLLGARAGSLAEMFAYGSFDEDGNIERITAVVLRDTQGVESFISFDENGRPIHLEIGNGSYVHIDYTAFPQNVNEVFGGHFSGTVHIFDFATQATESVPFDFTVDKALDALAQEIQTLTGEELKVLPDPNARSVSADNKVASRASGTVVYPMFLLPFVGLAYMVSYVAAAITAAVTLLVVEVVRVTLIAVFAPILLLTEITNAVLFFPILNVSLADTFPILPPFPIWILM